jgi:hypothetical protein
VVARTVSERAFEEYLDRRGFPIRYEELPAEATKPVDYTIEFGGQTIRLDVKEWEPRGPRLASGCFDPYEPIRKKIEEARDKFKQYKGRDEPCVLVLCHYGPQPIMLDPMAIFGAMLGDFGIEIPFNVQTGAGDISAAKSTFLSGGKMIHHTPKGDVRLQNTTISAIAVLAAIDVRARRAGVELSKMQAAAGRSFGLEESFNTLRELYARDQGVHIEQRLVVYDNVDAAVSLPPGFPTGPYDERFGKSGDRLRRIYVGVDLAAIEKEEANVGVRANDPFGLKT